MDVDVHQARRDVESANVYDLQCLRRIDMLSHRGDLPVADGNVPDRADVVFRIDDMAALQKQVVLGLREQAAVAKRIKVLLHHVVSLGEQTIVARFFVPFRRRLKIAGLEQVLLHHFVVQT